jgi:hypothetical protein
MQILSELIAQNDPFILNFQRDVFEMEDDVIRKISENVHKVLKEHVQESIKQDLLRRYKFEALNKT